MLPRNSEAYQQQLNNISDSKGNPINGKTDNLTNSTTATPNTETLYSLSRIYVTLLSLVKLKQSDAEYSGINDPDTLLKFINTTINELPSDYRRVASREINNIQTLIEKQSYEQAKEVIRKVKLRLDDLIAHSAPPERIRESLLQRSG